MSEAITVRKSDIKEGWLKILNAKGDKERMVPIAGGAMEALEVYIEKREKAPKIQYGSITAKSP